jgi:PIN domain nuclease of toxin-antitoxin system
MYLLDTHVLIWANTAPELLSPAARDAIETYQIKVSVVSLWELIAKKTRPGAPVREPLPWWDRYITRAGVEVLPVRVPHLSSLDCLPDVHRDPFDRMLLAQAGFEQLQLVSADRAFAGYAIEIIW